MFAMLLALTLDDKVTINMVLLIILLVCVVLLPRVWR